MPTFPAPPNSAPYDTVETVLQFARVIANDAGISMAGNLLSDAQPYTLTMLNLAWRKLQDRLENNNIESFPQEVIITNLPPQAATAFSDPAVQSYIDYVNYFDGIGYNASFFLPADMEIPLALWERPTGMNATFSMMKQAQEGLPVGIKSPVLLYWEWRGDKVYIKGSDIALDLRIRYRRILTDNPTTATQIPLIRCAVALAYLVVEILAGSRGSVILPVFQQEKEDAIKQLINQTTRKHQRINYRRIPYSRRGRW